MPLRCRAGADVCEIQLPCPVELSELSGMSPLVTGDRCNLDEGAAVAPGMEPA